MEDRALKKKEVFEYQEKPSSFGEYAMIRKKQ